MFKHLFPRCHNWFWLCMTLGITHAFREQFVTYTWQIARHGQTTRHFAVLDRLRDGTTWHAILQGIARIKFVPVWGLLKPLTWGNVDADDRHFAAADRLDDRGEVAAHRRLETDTEDGVDDETVGVCDELCVWRQVHQWRDVGFLALRRQVGIDCVPRWRFRVEYSRSVSLPSSSHRQITISLESM